MNSVLLATALLLIILPPRVRGTDETEQKPKAQPQVVRRVFAPGGGPWKGEAAFQGASWTALGPGLEKDTLMMQAHAGIGDRFPVITKDGINLFDVVLENGTDDHLVLIIHSEDEDQKVKVVRDKASEMTVSGVQYRVIYPSVKVAADKGEKPTSNKATIFIQRKLKTK